MPGIKTHCVQAALTGAAIAPFTSFGNTAAVCLTIIFIDVDHIIDYVRQTGSLRIWGVFPSSHITDSNLHRGYYLMHVFHTLEFMLLLGVLGLLLPVCWYMLGATLWHFALDIFMLKKRRLASIRALSILEYFIRARDPKKIVRFQDLLRIEGVAIPQDSWNYPAWIKHWQHCRPFC